MKLKRGFWANYETGTIVEIDEHERWMRREGNPQRLGVPDEVVETFRQFVPVKDRDDFIRYLLCDAPLMRVRGHGDWITFEFATENEEEKVRQIADTMAGPLTLLVISNLLTERTRQVFMEEFGTVGGEQDSCHRSTDENAR